ncbi:PREDICTED: uncharacterized protein LOC106751012 isoform X2 [Dinoponera quadriceps]|uniref:Uncharacterized protein LOC106751012 isoform X2 n=1 Tax=Dinoponera quadriceps TaxID=609295 RepID=A0A6P3Y867_DINQU|nr:PREDICTED: uncharacterized protein LOC106751012 isoform X2 [Dinoponera quadriceps]
MAYSLDPVRLRKFSDNLVKCSEELGTSTTSLSAEALLCAMGRDGKLLDDNGEYIRDAVVQDLKDVISDPSTLKRAQEMLTKCFDDDQSGSIGRERTIKIAIKCIIPILPLFDKPQ